MRYPIGILGISIFILYKLGITMKIKVSKLREVFKKYGLNEGIFDSLFKTKKSNIEKLRKQLDDLNSDIKNNLIQIYGSWDKVPNLWLKLYNFDKDGNYIQPK
jgi:hypothetical protein